MKLNRDIAEHSGEKRRRTRQDLTPKPHRTCHAGSGRGVRSRADRPFDANGRRGPHRAAPCNLADGAEGAPALIKDDGGPIRRSTRLRHSMVVHSFGGEKVQLRRQRQKGNRGAHRATKAASLFESQSANLTTPFSIPLLGLFLTHQRLFLMIPAEGIGSKGRSGEGSDTV